MAILTFQCPHCLTEHMGLHVVATRKMIGGDEFGAIYLHCPKCWSPSCATVEKTSFGGPGLHDFMSIEEDIIDLEWSVLAMWPSPPKPAIPDHLPPAIGRVLLQAERNFPTTGNEEAAGIMYRKALDLAITSIAADVKGNLKSRIEKLVERHDLTPSLGDWANQIRVLGNEAAHEEEPPTRDDLEALRGFTGLVLQYLFTLPAQVKMRKLLP